MDSAGSIDAVLQARALASTDHVALIAASGDGTVTYGSLGATAAQWIELVRASGGYGRTAVLSIEDPLLFATTYLGLLAAGMTVAPIDPLAAGQLVWEHAELVGAAVVVTDGELAGTTTAPVWPAQPRGNRLAPLSPIGVRRAIEPCVILSSSGTTGRPKLIPLDEARLMHNARAIAAHHGLTAADRGYSALPLHHVNAQVVGLLSTLVAGASLVLDARFHKTDFWEKISRHEVTWLNAVPAILAILARQPGPDVATTSRVRFARSASAPLPITVLADFEAAAGIRVLETYGMSEAASQITANPLDEHLRRPGSVGLPVAVQVRIGDDDHGGRPAEVHIKGPSVIATYLETDGSTRPAVSADGWLATGDIGRLDGDGYLFLSGRMDDVINRGGEKIHPRELEELLRTHSSVVDAAVAAAPDAVLGEVPIAFVVARPATDLNLLAEDLRNICSAKLPRSHHPHRLVVLDGLPVSPNGKLLRKSLAAWMQGHARGDFDWTINQ